MRKRRFRSGADASPRTPVTGVTFLHQLSLSSRLRLSAYTAPSASAGWFWCTSVIDVLDREIDRTHGRLHQVGGRQRL